MIQKAFLNTDCSDSTSSTACILTGIDIEDNYVRYIIKIIGSANRFISLHITGDEENDLYKLNTLIEHITNLRDIFLFFDGKQK